MFEKYHDEVISYAQSVRNKNGKDWEKPLFQYGKPYGLIECKDIKVYCLETGKSWSVDGLLNDMIFVEMTTNVSDGKEAKIILESRAFKRKYPNHKFVVFIKVNKYTRKSDGLNAHYDHLIRCKTIDNVLVGWDEVTKFIQEPVWDKELKISKLTNNTKPNNKSQIGKENQVNIQDKMIQVIMNQGPQFVGQVLNSMNQTKPKPKTKKLKRTDPSTKALRNKKKKYFNTNVQLVQNDHHDFVSLKELNLSSKSKFLNGSIATKIMNGGGHILMKSNQSKSSLMYGISRDWV